MRTFDIADIRSHPELKAQAAAWFHSKWEVPEEEYLASMDECISGGANVPQWYVALEDGVITGGVGVIENDFHVRRDLSPNVCALYVEPRRRSLGLAGALLEHVRRDMAALGVDTLYLITDHVGFYERYGWEFVTMAECTDGSAPARLYVSPRE